MRPAVVAARAAARKWHQPTTLDYGSSPALLPLQAHPTSRGCSWLCTGAPARAPPPFSAAAVAARPRKPCESRELGTLAEQLLLRVRRERCQHDEKRARRSKTAPTRRASRPFLKASPGTSNVCVARARARRASAPPAHGAPYGGRRVSTRPARRSALASPRRSERRDRAATARAARPQERLVPRDGGGRGRRRRRRRRGGGGVGGRAGRRSASERRHACSCVRTARSPSARRRPAAAAANAARERGRRAEAWAIVQSRGRMEPALRRRRARRKVAIGGGGCALYTVKFDNDIPFSPVVDQAQIEVEPPPGRGQARPLDAGDRV